MVVEVVMNHMGNEFYFEGYQSSHAPWRFHEDNGLREYQLKFRKESAEAARQRKPARLGVVSVVSC